MENWEKDFKENPVSPKEFLNEKFLNKELLEGVNDWVKDNFIEFFKDDNPNNIYVLKNKSHVGKSTLVILCNIYILYLFNLLKDPIEYFGVSEGTKFFALLESSKKKAFDILMRLNINKYSKEPMDNLNYISVDESTDLIGLFPIFAIGNLDFFEDGEKDFLNLSKDIFNRLNNIKRYCTKKPFFKMMLECNISDKNLISEWAKELSNLEGKNVLIKVI